MANGRNELCSCGSGKKSKHCCGTNKTSFLATHGPTILVAIVLAIGASAIIAALKQDNTAAPAAPAAVAAQQLPVAAQPAATATTPAAATTPQSALTPPPQRGQVWSEEHKHWHNAPVQPPVKIDVAGGVTPPVTSPTGELAPSPGAVWDAEHKHWHFPGTNSNVTDVRVFPRGKPPAAPPSSARPQPPGPVPDGMVWSTEHGHWHKKDGTTKE